jgi:hypothetical protein
MVGVEEDELSEKSVFVNVKTGLVTPPAVAVT